MNPESSPQVSWASRHPIAASVSIAAGASALLFGAVSCAYDVYDQQRSHAMEVDEATTLPELADAAATCATYEQDARDGTLEPEDRLGVLACEQYLRNPHIMVVDFAGHSDKQLQTYVDMLDTRSREIGLVDGPVFEVISASTEMQQAYQASQTGVCDVIFKEYPASDTDLPPTAADIAQQSVTQGSYDRLIALTDKLTCIGSDGMGAAAIAHGGKIDLYGVDLSEEAGMVEAAKVSRHEFAHTVRLGHSGIVELTDDVTIQLRTMREGRYDLWDVIANSKKTNHYGGDGIMGDDRRRPGLNAVQRYQLYWPERALGQQKDHLVNLQEAPATFTSASTTEDLAVVKLAVPVELPYDASYAVTKEQKEYVKTMSGPSVEELYFVANEQCPYKPGSAAATQVSIYAHDTSSGDIFYIVSPEPMLNKPKTPGNNEYNFSQCQPSPTLIKRDYAADLHIGGNKYVTLRYDGDKNELRLSKVFTQLQPSSFGLAAE